jgi:hypothetical protein
MALICRMLESAGDARQDVEMLAKYVGPLIDAFWRDRGHAWYGTGDWSVQAVPLAQLWMDRTMVIVVAEDDGKPAGFLLGIHLTPLFTKYSVFHVEAYYGTTPEADKAMLDFLRQMFGFTNDHQLALPCYAGENVMGDAPWPRTVRRTEVYGR